MPDFHTLTVAQVERLTSDAVAVTFDVPPELAAAFTSRPGQHIALRRTFDGVEQRRTYSICAVPGDPLRIAIKRADGGLFSTWANAAIEPGMALEVLPPAGRFVLSESTGEGRSLLMLAAGSGITPILAMVHHALAREPKSGVTLVYGNHRIDSIMFCEELENLKDRYLDRFDLIHVLSRNEEIEAPLLQGRITGDKVRALAERRIDIARVDEVFLCGPGTMIKDARDTLLALGLPRERIHHEFFAAGGGAYRTKLTVAEPSTSPEESGGAEIIAVLDGARHRFRTRTGEPVIEAAIRAGLKVPYACRGGMCCTCRARIVEGAATMMVNYSLETWEIEKGFTLTCQAVPTTGSLTVDYDAM